jgi:hypothetical protein
MDYIKPPIGSVWFQRLYPERLFIVIEHKSDDKWGSVVIQRVDTGSKSTENWRAFINNRRFSSLETMEVK